MAHPQLRICGKFEVQHFATFESKWHTIEVLLSLLGSLPSLKDLPCQVRVAASPNSSATHAFADPNSELDSMWGASQPASPDPFAVWCKGAGRIHAQGEVGCKVF